ncbi:MAG: hypothetical protein Q7K55_01610 [Candidatus Levybacteria bacterium]|nr:hypothetical protein [Candidatus Levybacteria bacterium]
MVTKIRLFFLLIIGVGLFLTAFTTDVVANHSWGDYHWARISNPFTLKLGDNLSTSWDPYLAITSIDWSISSVLDTTIVTGGTNPRNCRATSGRVEVCNNKYGNNGWLGLAQIWASGSHIVQGVTKVNDTYFNRAQYNTPAWKNLVMCQEVGHTLGLNHQDEDFSNANLGTCMDYTSNPDSNQHPNAHDYEELETIYAHLDEFTTIQSGTQKLPFGLSISRGILDSDFGNRSDWGRELRNNGHVALYERDFGGGNKLFTFIIWAQE